MATNLITFRPAPIIVSAVGSDPNRRRSSSASGWWTPLLGWSSDPDYHEPAAQTRSQTRSDADETRPYPKQSVGARFAPGCFTEEKARRLRMLTKETASFHDVMYHSAIASRLASDFKHRSDK